MFNLGFETGQMNFRAIKLDENTEMVFRFHLFAHLQVYILCLNTN